MGDAGEEKTVVLAVLTSTGEAAELGGAVSTGEGEVDVAEEVDVDDVSARDGEVDAYMSASEC